jgi:hypothetical protein
MTLLLLSDKITLLSYLPQISHTLKGNYLPNQDHQNTFELITLEVHNTNYENSNFNLNDNKNGSIRLAPDFHLLLGSAATLLYDHLQTRPTRASVTTFRANMDTYQRQKGVCHLAIF